MREIKSAETWAACLPEVKLSPVPTFTANNEIIFELRCGLFSFAIIADVFGINPSVPWESARRKLASSLLYIMLVASSVLILESIMGHAVLKHQTVTVWRGSFFLSLFLSTRIVYDLLWFDSQTACKRGLGRMCMSNSICIFSDH